MPVSYSGTMAELGAELQAMRVLEVPWEYVTKVDAGGNTYVIDKLNAVYTNTVQDEESVENKSKNSLADLVATAQVDVHQARKESFEEYWLRDYLGIELLGLSSDEAATPIEYVYDEALLANGQVQILSRSGPLGKLYADMIANSKTVNKPTTLTAGAIAANSANVGSVTESGVTILDHCLSGTIEIKCTSDTVGDEKFSVKLILDVPLIDGTREREADNELTLNKSFQDGPTGFSITLGYGSVVESGDGGNIFSSTTIATPGESDSSKGQYHIRVVRMSGSGGNPDFRVYWYNASTRLPSELVATADVTGTSGTTVLVMTGPESVITTTFSMTNAAVALPAAPNEDNDIVFDLDLPRVGDVWTKAITNSQDCNFNSMIPRRWPISLPSVDGGGETEADSLAEPLTMDA